MRTDIADITALMAEGDRPDMFGRTVADMIAEGRADGAPLRAVQFAMADGEKPWPGFTDGSHWNGFLNVWVTPIVWNAITAYWHDAHGGAAGSFWAEGCALCPAPVAPTADERADHDARMAEQTPIELVGRIGADAYAGLVGAMAYGWANTEWLAETNRPGECDHLGAEICNSRGWHHGADATFGADLDDLTADTDMEGDSL